MHWNLTKLINNIQNQNKQSTKLINNCSEAAFSALVTIKTKQRNRLDVQHGMRVALSKTQPQFSVLVQKRQQQASH